MTTFNITIFLFFSFFLKEIPLCEAGPKSIQGIINTSETTPVTQGNLRNHVTTSDGTTTSNSNVSVSTGETWVTTEVSNISSLTPSVRSENSTSNVTVSVTTESTVAVNASTDDNSTSFSVTSSGQSTYSTAASNTMEIKGQMSMLTTTPATMGTNSLSVIAFAVIILIIILVIVVVILVSVITLRFKHCGCQETPQDTSKARSEGPSESSHANGEKESITLVSMRSLYTEAGGQESSVQGYLQNESNEIDETINNFSK
ncbi:endothelial cell-specific chemotaxis regulator-like isoform X2 [Hypanus sabinus]|uniref:endothelial cell-specific chemotaxis regulator-like isoform X2 n=1 Tax=Hypanus sabinus TaxID=79690 RepID=UPI0028C41860|nr:endothelial cell-specific chemotaxis regulator-like isoform X2 [Hypanus sabinus]